MHGLLIIDKPFGISSHDVVRKVRRLLSVRRVGHAGTLDPLATGLLVVGVGEGTRLIEFLMADAKSYRATLKLGITTDTQDSQGQVLKETPVPPLSMDDLVQACKAFVGPIEQTPPMYSALKKDGVPLYKLARQGVEIERTPRNIVIHRLDIERVDLPLIDIGVDCSKGTYIRTLCQDIGERLGVGAHMTQLRRTRSGVFTEQDAITLEELEEALNRGEFQLMPYLEALRGWPRVQVAEPALEKLKNGVPPCQDAVHGDAIYPGCHVALTDGECLIAMARFEPERTTESRGDFLLLRVFPFAAK